MTEEISLKEEEKIKSKDEEIKSKEKEEFELEQQLRKLGLLNLSFDYLKLNIASAEKIQKWAERRLPKGRVVGEVSRPDTLNYRSFEPEPSGLFCQRIFGPTKSWTCSCRKYSGILLDKICEACLVELTESRVRRYRMGYINLTCPVAHFWYINGTPNYLTIILRTLNDEIRKTDIEEIIYFHNESENIKTNSPFYRYSLIPKKAILNEVVKLRFSEYLDRSSVTFRKGCEILIQALDSISVNFEIAVLRRKLESAAKKNPAYGLRRLRIFENFEATNTELKSMILTVLPVLPPNLRPLVEVEEARLVSADANELYRLILVRNIRGYHAVYTDRLPDIISYQSRRLLQEAVDFLIDNGRVAANKTYVLNDRALKGLTEALEGKQGRFRQNLLGKRVDYSARSVIVVGPGLRLNQCGLPYDIAAKIFEPHLLNFLLKILPEKSRRLKLANRILKKRKIFIWRLLEILLNKNCILLNRAPTLHKFGIQAFHPVLVLGQAIQLHPLVCTGFNADFDGDQMAVHLPLYEASQIESQMLMRPSNNILSPSNGEVILKPTQDMVIGSYYLSLMIKKKESNLSKYFSSESDALNAFYMKKLQLHETILVKYDLKNMLKLRQKDLKIFQELESLSKVKIKILKVLKAKKNLEKIYLITNIGLISAYLIKQDFYALKELYLESTVGRLIFTDTIKTIFNKVKIS